MDFESLFCAAKTESKVPSEAGHDGVSDLKSFSNCFKIINGNMKQTCNRTRFTSFMELANFLTRIDFATLESICSCCVVGLKLEFSSHYGYCFAHTTVTRFGFWNLRSV